MQVYRNKFGLKHRVTVTIHSYMGDNMNRMETDISRNDPPFRLWYRGQSVVIISITK